MDNIIETRKLTKRYGKYHALENVSIKVRKGEIYGLIGKNGAGKSTLFRVLMGLSSSTSGGMNIYGKESASGLNESRHKIGFMMGAKFFPYLTAEENLNYYRKVKEISDKKEVERVLELVEMADVKKKFRTFSMGMKQRVSIANALLGNPDTVLLDEPINGLDPQGIADFRRLVQKLNRERGITFVISSHILGELGLMATRFGFIHEGKLLEEINREDIQKKTQEQIIIKVDQPEKAAVIVEEHFPGVRYTINGDHELLIMDMTDQINEIAKLLVNNHLELYKLMAQSCSLEEYYLNLIGYKGGENND